MKVRDKLLSEFGEFSTDKKLIDFIQCPISLTLHNKEDDEILSDIADDCCEKSCTCDECCEMFLESEV